MSHSTIMVSKPVKDQAAKRAKHEGFPLSTIVTILLKDYSLGKIDIGTRPTDHNKNPEGWSEAAAQDASRHLPPISPEEDAYYINLLKA